MLPVLLLLVQLQQNGLPSAAPLSSNVRPRQNGKYKDQSSALQEETFDHKLWLLLNQLHQVSCVARDAEGT